MTNYLDQTLAWLEYKKQNKYKPCHLDPYNVVNEKKKLNITFNSS